MTCAEPTAAPCHPAAPGDDGWSWAATLSALLQGRDLTSGQAAGAMRRIIAGEATPAQVAGFAIALRAKGESPAEVSGLVEALTAAATPVVIEGRTVDIAGTGGDGTGAVNISTMAAIVAAATGLTVVKHGGRAASSSGAGAADVLERLGVALELTAEQSAQVAAEVGITFLFGPSFSPGLRHAAGPRRELGVPTVFNLLGPLINPAAPRHQVIGVADGRMAPVVAEVLAAAGRSALVVHGLDGMDKLSTPAPSQLWIVRDGQVTAGRLDARELGLARPEPSALRGGDAQHNAQVVLALLDGQRGPIRDVVLLNAAAVLVVAADDAVAPLLEQFAVALRDCAAVVDSGAARATLQRWVAAGRRAAVHPAPRAW
jgi:anthranilate phosphoribosyltransferase